VLPVSGSSIKNCPGRFTISGHEREKIKFIGEFDFYLWQPANKRDIDNFFTNKARKSRNPKFFVTPTSTSNLTAFFHTPAPLDHHTKFAGWIAKASVCSSVPRRKKSKLDEEGRSMTAPDMTNLGIPKFAAIDFKQVWFDIHELIFVGQLSILYRFQAKIQPKR
jgi:hypothetical protein